MGGRVNPNSYDKNFLTTVASEGDTEDLYDPVRAARYLRYVGFQHPHEAVIDRQLTDAEFNMVLEGDLKLARHGWSQASNGDLPNFDTSMSQAIDTVIDDAHTDGLIPWTVETAPDWLRHSTDLAIIEADETNPYDLACAQTPQRYVATEPVAVMSRVSRLDKARLQSRGPDGAVARRTMIEAVAKQHGITAVTLEQGPQGHPWPEDITIRVVAKAQPRDTQRVIYENLHLQGLNSTGKVMWTVAPTFETKNPSGLRLSAPWTT